MIDSYWLAYEEPANERMAVHGLHCMLGDAASATALVWGRTEPSPEALCSMQQF